MNQPTHKHFASLGFGALPVIHIAALADADPKLFIPEYTLQTHSINFMTSGEMAGTLNGSPVHIGPGRLILWLPGDRIMLRGVPAKGQIVCRWLMFTWPASKEETENDFSLPRQCELKLPEQQKARAILDGLLEITQRAEPDWNIGALAKLLELMALWRTASRRQTESSNSAIDRRIRLSLTFMEGNFRRPIKNAEIAAASHLTLDQLKRLFRQSMGTSPLQYLIKLRIQAARRLLAENPRMSVRDACLKAGFGSTKHFSVLFRKHFDLSPREFRSSVLPWNTQ